MVCCQDADKEEKREKRKIDAAEREAKKLEAQKTKEADRARTAMQREVKRQEAALEKERRAEERKRQVEDRKKYDCNALLGISLLSLRPSSDDDNVKSAGITAHMAHSKKLQHDVWHMQMELYRMCHTSMRTLVLGRAVLFTAYLLC